MGKNRATRDANEREKKSTDGEPKFLSCGVCRPTPLTERAVQIKLARKINDKRRSKKNLEGLYEALAPGSNIIKVSPTTSTIKEPGEEIVTLRNSDTAKFGTLQERQIPLKVYLDRRGPRTSEKLIDEHIQSHKKQFTREIKGDKKLKHRRREPSSGVSSSRSDISRAIRKGVFRKFGAFPGCETSTIQFSKKLFP